jgi:hypothetical protein
VYTIRIRRGIRFQPHPAFVDANHALAPERIARLQTPYALPTGTRELTADDYIYEIKRLASPRLHSPILGLMSEYIVGLGEFAPQTTGSSASGRRSTAGFLVNFGCLWG